MPFAGTYTVPILGGALVAAALCGALAAWRGWRRVRAGAIGVAAGALAAWLALYAWRPRWLVLALADPRGPAEASAPAWQERAPGLETAEVTITLRGEQVDAIALVRLDPARFALRVHWDAAAPKTAEAWQATLGAAVVINGSYFEPDLAPSTPLRSADRSLGPARYASSHGALVLADDGADILDLADRDAVPAIAGYREAMVSFPLLVDPRGGTRAAGHDDWFANRVFVAIDRGGRVVLGTTRTGFCSLRRLGELLARAPLDLRVALNLDGGPLASQVVRVPGFERRVHGTAEIQGGGDLLRLAYQAWRDDREIALPIVLAAHPR